jgi:hypothetical protein
MLSYREIPKDTITELRVKQTKTKDRCIKTGIATSAILGHKDAHLHK